MRKVNVPYVKFRKANTLRNDSTQHDWQHWGGYRDQIQQVLEQTLEHNCCGRGHILLLGAGNGNDVPISYIESIFERITIVDIDEKALDRFLTKSAHPEKYERVIIDLTGVGAEVSSLDDLKEKVDDLLPNVDFSPLHPSFDVVMNLCFTTQLISAFFYRKKNKVAHTPEFSTQLDRLLERIHINIFESLRGLLASDGVIVHLTDTLLLQHMKTTGYTSPATFKTLELTGGNLRENLDLIYEHLPDLAEQGLCLPGAFVHVHPQIMRLYKVELRFSLLWEFVHDEYEDRDYFVSAHVLTKL
ncbi:hypothetical protein [Paenibacillus monticola]|nr:hypothetical protein [Paenibacillus monticola]